MISKKTCGSRPRRKNLPTSKSPVSNAAATSASSKRKSSASASLPDSVLDVGRLQRRSLAKAGGAFEVSPMLSHDKLFIPGPVEVSPKTWAAFSKPMIGHRGEAFRALYRAIHPRLQTLFGTKQPVFLSTSSAWGVMEASIRNLVFGRVLNCMCGAFSDKWLDVSRRCGKNAEPLQVDWGKHIDPQALDPKLRTGDFD